MFDFSSPAGTGDTATNGSSIYRYDGAKWLGSLQTAGGSAVFDFPAASVGLTATNGSAVYTFDGVKWSFAGSPPVSTGTLSNDGGVLVVADAAWPTGTTGLAAGALWSNSGVASVVGPTTPSGGAPPVYFGSITSTALLALGGSNLPLTSPAAGSNQLWNNGGVVCVA